MGRNRGQLSDRKDAMFITRNTVARNLPKIRSNLLVACTVISVLFSFSIAFAQEFTTERISDRIFRILEPSSGESQIVIQSEKGLVVLNAFWSEVTARKFKKEIVRELGRDDFVYTINTMDRLDMIGGNAAYGETEIVSHSSLIDKYYGKDEEVRAEITRLVDMWRWKEDVSRERLPTHEEGSEAWNNEKRWMTTCGRRADELEQSFSLVLPTMLYDEKKKLPLGDISLELIWFGQAGDYNGMTVTVIPEEKTAIIPTFIMHPQHFAPHPHSEYRDLDVPKWIAVLEEILEGEDAVETVICGMRDVWPRERAHEHLVYIRRLWNRVTTMEAEGKTLSEVWEQLSFENEFAFVKEMKIYEVNSDDWLRPQHMDHARLFYLQHKTLASQIMMDAGMDSLQTSLARVRELRKTDSKIYFEEASINGIGYYLIGQGRFADAIEVLKLNVELFPESSNVYDSLGEAYMKNGDLDKAIENYNKSLELNPENENAKQMLEEIRRG